MFEEDITFVASCDGSAQRYVRLLPADFDAGAPHDVLIALHGHGSDRWQFVKESRDECRAARDVAAAHDMVFIAPDYRAKTSWMGPSAEADMLDIICGLRNTCRVGKVFLYGGSMGAASSLTFTALHSELIAGVAAVNGIANHLEYENFQDAIAQSFGGTKAEKPDEYHRRSAELHAAAFTMPVGLTTSGKDTSTPPESVHRLVEAIRKSNPNVLLIHRETEGHRTNHADALAILEFVVNRAGAGDSKTGGRPRLAPPMGTFGQRPPTRQETP